MDADKLDELERLLAGLRAIVASYEKKNPLRTADFHGEGCGCYRCAVDGCSAAINALEELVAMGRRVAELERENEDLRQLLSSAHVLLYAGQRLQTHLSDWAIDSERHMDTARAALQTKGT
jgi:hypothetical protein